MQSCWLLLLNFLKILIHLGVLLIYEEQSSLWDHYAPSPVLLCLPHISGKIKNKETLGEWA